MSIRVKILLGFLILTSMLFISGALLIFELTRQGKAVKLLISDSYQSIDYSKQMLDAIERQKNNLLYHIATKDSLINKELEEAVNQFNINLYNAGLNLTHKEERLIVDSISHYYKIYRQRSSKAMISNSFTLTNYLDSVQQVEIRTTKLIKKLMILNQEELYKSAAFHEASAQRAITPGLIVIITGILFTLIFTYLVNHYFVSPIIRITKAVNEYVKYKKTFDIPLETKDELYNLKESISNLISHIRSSQRDE